MKPSLVVVVVLLGASLAGAALYRHLSAPPPVGQNVGVPIASGAPAVTAPPSAPSALVLPAAPSYLPQDPEQERLEHRRWLYATVDALLRASEIDRARKYLDEGLARYGDDAAPEWRDLDVGYRLIADCLENPRDPKPRVRARAFIGVTEARGLVPKLESACQ